MAFSPQFLDELKARISLATVIGRRVKLTRRGKEHTGCCPFHNEKSPSFTVNEDKGFGHCFGCGWHGDAIKFEMRANHLSFVEAVEKLAAEVGLEVPQATPEERQRQRRQASLLQVMDKACEFFEQQLMAPGGAEGLAYLRNRGITDETIARFRLGWAPDSYDAFKRAIMCEEMPESLLLEAGLLKKPEGGGNTYAFFRGRLTFPIFDRRSQVVAFGARTLKDEQPKYLNSPDTPLFRKGSTLYGYTHAREQARELRQLVGVEGYMDVVTLHQSGLRYAVAPLGTALTETQLEEMWRLVDEPTLCLDGDEAGQRAMERASERALPILKPGKSLRFAVLPASEDPDSLVKAQGPDAMRAFLDAAHPLFEVVWKVALDQHQLDTPERKAAFENDILARARSIRDQTVRGHYEQAFKVKLRDSGVTAPVENVVSQSPKNSQKRARFQPTDAASLLDPPVDMRDDALPIAFIANALGMAPDEVPVPTTPMAGWKGMPYFEAPADASDRPTMVGEFPCAVFGTSDHNGNIHAQRIFVRDAGQGLAELGTNAEGEPREPRKLARKKVGENVNGYGVIWGDITAAKTFVIAKEVESGAAIAQALRSEVEGKTTCVVACLSDAGVERWRPPGTAERIIVACDRDEARKGLGYKRGEAAGKKLAARHVHRVQVSIAVAGQEGQGITWAAIFRTQGADLVRVAVLEGGRRYDPEADDTGLFSNPYKIIGSGFSWTRVDQKTGDRSDVPLTDFTARIVRDVLRDNGAETVRYFDIDAVLASGSRRRITVPADVFPRMNWVSTELGHAARVAAGAPVRDHVRSAIQCYSEAEEEVIYGHTGWRKIDGRWVYLHGNGAIGEAGEENSVRTDLHELADGGYQLPEAPDPSTTEARVLVREAVDLFMDSAKPHITVPLFSTYWLAPTASFFPLSFMVFLAGFTGTGKTSVSALVQQAFGPRMHGKNLPASWFDTANALEMKAFLAKDAPVLIDDFVPRGSKEDVQRAKANFARIAQNVGNGAARGRMQDAGRLRAERRPRGLVITTGEDIVDAQSALSRTIVIDVTVGDVHFGGGLDKAQEAAADGKFASMMATYIRWMAKRLNAEGEAAIGKQMSKWFTFLRQRLTDAVDKGTHRRTPENLAFVGTGLCMFLRFAQEIGAIDSLTAVASWDGWWKTLVKLARGQGENLSQTDPMQQFFSLMRSALLSGHAHIAHQEGGAPTALPSDTMLRSFGWTEGGFGPAQRLGDCIGWIPKEGGHLFLDHEAALRIVNKMRTIPFDWTKTTLAKRMKERNIIQQTCPHRGTNTVKRKCEGMDRNVLVIGLDTLLGEGDDDAILSAAAAMGTRAGTADGATGHPDAGSMPPDVIAPVNWREVIDAHPDQVDAFEEAMAIAEVDNGEQPEAARLQVARDLGWVTTP